LCLIASPPEHLRIGQRFFVTRFFLVFTTQPLIKRNSPYLKTMLTIFATVRYFKVPADLLPRWCGRHLVFLSYLTLQLIGGRVGDNEAALLCN